MRLLKPCNQKQRLDLSPLLLKVVRFISAAVLIQKNCIILQFSEHTKLCDKKSNHARNMAEDVGLLHAHAQEPQGKGNPTVSSRCIKVLSVFWCNKAKRKKKECHI